MTTTETEAFPFAGHPEFHAAVRLGVEHGFGYGFADWFEERGLPAHAAGWRFLATGYDGGGSTWQPKFVHAAGAGGIWVMDYPLRQGSLSGRTPAEVVDQFLTEWAEYGLSVEQLDATRTLLTSTEQVRTLGGFAGTGKSRVLKHLHAALPNYIVCAFTGKAVDVLRRLGIRHAQTIHSCLYSREGREPNVRWVRKNRWALGMNWPTQVNGFLVDEASMVSRAEFEVMASHGLPIIAVGDHGQLPPVGEDAGLMREPMVRLETVHRNAGPIARFAEWLRQGGAAADWPGRKKGFGVAVLRQPPLDSLRAADQIICGRNKTRLALNRQIRHLRGRALFDPDGPPVVGDRIICTRNNRGLNVFNGQQGVITAIMRRPPANDRPWLMWRPIGSDQVSEEIPYHPDSWNSEKGVKDDRRANFLVAFDYAYAITCHKAQGAEWNNVVVYEERLPEIDPARWNYTAASRARTGLIWVTG